VLQCRERVGHLTESGQHRLTVIGLLRIKGIDRRLALGPQRAA